MRKTEEEVKEGSKNETTYYLLEAAEARKEKNI